MKVNVADAKNILTELIRAVEDGESVTICRRGVPVVDLVLTTTSTGQKPKLGTPQEKMAIHDPEAK
jgi:antitoxin (DNA-binding transcriptional repressor) of toxin-antitoxin stability system